MKKPHKMQSPRRKLNDKEKKKEKRLSVLLRKQRKIDLQLKLNLISKRDMNKKSLKRN
jgi:hypothetical protein